MFFSLLSKFSILILYASIFLYGDYDADVLGFSKFCEFWRKRKWKIFSSVGENNVPYIMKLSA